MQTEKNMAAKMDVHPEAAGIDSSAPTRHGGGTCHAAIPAKPDLESLALPPLSRAFLGNLLRLQLLTPSVVEGFVRTHAERLSQQDSAEACGQALVEAGLLTQYQLEQILA